MQDNSYNGNIFKKIFFDCFTGKTNDIFDSVKFLLFFASISLTIVFIVHSIKTGDADFFSFASAQAALLFGAGATLKIKQSTEQG